MFFKRHYHLKSFKTNPSTPQKTNIEAENHPEMKRNIFQTFMLGVPDFGAALEHSCFGLVATTTRSFSVTNHGHVGTAPNSLKNSKETTSK